MKVKIAILTYGWVFVGVHLKDGTTHTLASAKNIRRHSTGKGLGFVARNGDENVTLDEAGTIEFPESSLIGLIDCDDEKWEVPLGLEW